MADFKLTIADPKTGKCVQREFKDESNALLGKKISDKIEGDSINLEGYELELTGGSDNCGFPMRKDVPGTSRKRILAIEGVGLKKKARGIKQRKTVCGNTVYENIVQINLKIVKQGKENLFAAAKEGEAKPEEKAESKEKPAEKKAEEKKEEPKPEAKEKKPKEEAKPEEKK